MYTINNYTEDDIKRISSLECSYNVFGLEVGESGTPHIQGCITFRKAMRFKAAAKLLKGHLTRPKVVEAARNYCMKDNKFTIINNCKQGHRTDLEDAANRLVNGESLRSVALSFPHVYVKYPTGFGKLTELLQQPRDFKPTVSWFYGETGTGKSHSVFLNETDIWVSPCDAKFFNGYANQQCALFDDIRGSFSKFSEFLRIIDRWPYIANVKNSYRQFNSRRIYITCNRHPELVWDKEDEDLCQLIRRIDNIVFFPRRDFRIVRKGTWPFTISDTSGITITYNRFDENYRGKTQRLRGSHDRTPLPIAANFIL